MKSTPLESRHKALGAKMVEFAGYNMPVVYTNIQDEHHAVRKGVGVFDVSHMGEFLVTGPGAESFLQRMLTNDVSRLSVGGAQYTIMCYENGGMIDDGTVFRLAENNFRWIGGDDVSGLWLREQAEKKGFFNKLFGG